MVCWVLIRSLWDRWGRDLGLGWFKCKKQVSKCYPFDSFLVIWKERNSGAFDSLESSINRLKDRQIHYFGFILLGHDIISDVDFRNLVDT